MTIWKDVKGYEGLYQISNEGSVKSIARIVSVNSSQKCRSVRENILKLNERPNDYLFVDLSKNNVAKIHSIHVLVALHFVPNPDGKPEINHKDGNKKNNNDWNLEWSTKSENARHTYDVLGRKGFKSAGKVVYCYNQDLTLIKQYPKVSAVEMEGFNSRSVATAARTRKVNYKGFVWSYTPLHEAA